jgi:ketosteroid isomerase-like protein
MDPKHKYLKYKTKYLRLQSQLKNDNPVKRHLMLYEKLNTDGMNHQNWDLIEQIYHPNATMRMANNPPMKGFPAIKKMMLESYVMSPDCKFINRGIKFGSGDWTVQQQIMTGTFTGPMKAANGDIYPPTGKKYEIDLCSFVRWRDDRIIEETIFFDNDAYAKQLGLNACAVLDHTDKKLLCEKLSYVTFGRGDEADATVRRHLVKLENFNFNGYNTRDWTLIPKLYDADIKFKMANITEFSGIDNLIKQMTSGIKDEKVIILPINFGAGDWVATTFLMGSQGENPWAMEHCSLTRWSEGKIVEIIAFWDNAEAQIEMNNLRC